MREVPINKPTVDNDGLLFHVTTLSDAIPDGPQGIWIENALVAKNPILRERERNAIRYRFIAMNPLHGIAETAPIRLFHHITSQSMAGTSVFGNSVSLDLYAEAMSTDTTMSLINQARGGTDPGPLTTLAQQMLRDGYELSCEFVNILRQDYGQYWLRPPAELSQWTGVLYYSKPDQRWYRIDAEHEFAAKLLRRDWGSESEKTDRPWVLLKVISEGDLERLASAGAAPEPSFADEMVSTALIELRHNRMRSAVVHAFIAYETAAKRGLEALLKGRLKGLEREGPAHGRVFAKAPRVRTFPGSPRIDALDGGQIVKGTAIGLQSQRQVSTRGKPPEASHEKLGCPIRVHGCSPLDAGCIGRGAASPLRLLYVGNTKTPRPGHFAELLKKHFTKVTVSDRAGFDPGATQNVDVVLFDWSQGDSKMLETPVPFGRFENWSKPTVLLSSAGLLVAGRWQLIGGAG